MATKWKKQKQKLGFRRRMKPPPPLKECLKCALNIQQNHMWHKPTHWWPTDRVSDCSQMDNKVTWPQKHSSSFDWILSALFVPGGGGDVPDTKKPSVRTDAAFVRRSRFLLFHGHFCFAFLNICGFGNDRSQRELCFWRRRNLKKKILKNNSGTFRVRFLYKS